MRFQYGRLLPYLLVVILLFLSQSVQESFSLKVQETKLKIYSCFSKKSQQPRDQTIAPLPVQPLEESHKDLCFFHETLDSISPWICAKVLSHKELPWSHTAWIDIGTETADLLFPVVTGSPVVYGNHVVGIVEQVGKKASLVRLLSDPLVRPSVQVMRNGVDQEVESLVLLLQQKIVSSPSLILKESHRTALMKLLSELRSSISKEQPLFLAKGEIQGCISVQKPSLLRGVGFNYDVKDENGPARDIRTGQVGGVGPKLPLIQPNDLLVTNGLDGLYPPSLRVAIVERVLPLEEGGYAYEVEATASCPHFLDMRYVAILPPMPQEMHDESIDLAILLKQIEQEVQKEGV